MALLRTKGPMHPGDLLTDLPKALLVRGSDVEMPLSVGWLRFRLRAMAEAGKPLAEEDGRFAPVEEARGSPAVDGPEEAEVRAPPPSLGDSVMWEIRRLLLERGPMKPVGIRKHLPHRVHEAARKHWKGGLDRLAKDMSVQRPTNLGDAEHVNEVYGNGLSKPPTVAASDDVHAHPESEPGRRPRL